MYRLRLRAVAGERPFQDTIHRLEQVVDTGERVPGQAGSSVGVRHPTILADLRRERPIRTG
ncbi:hypothetical protein BTZ20_0237 [Rhodococcus sp. MTM3W5.2]|nr:hypothetical protein BTZ20_0237 [Rhodococcus sp. MTM3W5.2]